MKLLVEFDDKAEMDTFFEASEKGALIAPKTVWIQNQQPQSFGLRAEVHPDDPEAIVLGIELRGNESAQQVAPGEMLKVT